MLRVGDRDITVLANLMLPRVVVFGGLLSAEECDALVALSRPRLQRSTILDPDTGAVVYVTVMFVASAVT